MVRFIADHKQKLKKLLPKKLLRAAKLAYLKQLMAKYQKEPIHPADDFSKIAGIPRQSYAECSRTCRLSLCGVRAGMLIPVPLKDFHSILLIEFFS